MQFNSHLHFSGQCEEAFKFYEQCFGGKIEGVFYYEGAPGSPGVPADWGKKVMHESLAVGDQKLMGMDAPPDRFLKPQGFHVNIAVKNVAEGKKLFEALSGGGKISMPFAQTFWSPGFAMFTDRFGTPWMINTDAA